MMNNSNRILFSDYIEKLNERKLVWNRRWMCVEHDRLVFYTTRPFNETEISKPKSVFLFKKSIINSYKEYKIKSNKKNNVIVIQQFHENPEQIIISVKNEKIMQNLIETLLKYISENESENDEYRQRNSLNTYTQPIVKKNQQFLQFSSEKKNNENGNYSLYRDCRQNLRSDKDRLIRHNKNRSCELLDTKAWVNTTQNVNVNVNSSVCVKPTKLNYNNSANNSNSKKNKNTHSPLENNKKRNVYLASRNISVEHSNIIKTPIDNEMPNMNIKILNEENTSLSKIINNMLLHSKKTNKTRTRLTDSFVNNYNNKFEESLTNIDVSTENFPLHMKDDILEKRKKQINKMIKLTYHNKLINSSEKATRPHKLNFNQSLFNDDEPNISFTQEEDYIKTVTTKIENFEEYIFDSYILKSLLESYNLKKEDLGNIYNSLTKDYIQAQILTEMIAMFSKRFLTESVLKSLDITFKEKDMNKDYIVSPSHQHSIEYCIVDIFNTFLGNNKESDDFYAKVLPGYLSETFKIDLLLDIRNRISIPNLFVVMQFHNKIYFNENMDINFTDPSPFVTQDIKYISPYYINKWYSEIQTFNITYLKERSDNTNNAYPYTTNIKRMKFNNFEMRESFDKMLNYLKEYEKTNDETRISLMRNIYFHIMNKKNEIALKICDFYVQKYTDTLFLNPIIYLILSELYNNTLGIDLARLFFDKALNILEWLYPEQTNPLIIDIYYTFSLILMKQIDYIEYIKEVEELLNKSRILCDKFYEKENEKKVKICLQFNFVKLVQVESEDIQSDYVNDIFKDIEYNLDFLHSKGFLKEESIYLNLFVDIICSTHVDDNIKKKFLERLHQLKKLLKSTSIK